MRKIILSVILLIASGCSAVESLKASNTVNILIDTPHVEGAECNISDKMGRKWNVWETPGAVAIQEGHPPLMIVCTKKGFKKSVLTINEHKEELLTIDGKRVDLTIFNQFPTKAPRLVPTAIKEVAGFVQDPTGSLSTTYPNEIVVWMEPKVWQSEDQMREWAFDKQIQDNKDFISEEDAKLTEEQRKAKRRADQKARKDYMDKVKKRLQDAGKKGVKNTMKILNPEPAINKAVEGGRDVLNLNDEVERSRNSLKAVGNGANSAVHKMYPGNTKDFLNERNKVRGKVQDSREKEDGTIEEENDDTKAVPTEKSIPMYKYQDTSPQDLFEGGDGAKGYKYNDKGMRVGR